MKWKWEVITGRKKPVLMMVLFVFLYHIAGMFGVFEWLLSEPYEKFHWPLEYDPKIILNDRSGTHQISQINPHPFQFQILPTNLCRDSEHLVILIKTRADDADNRELLRRAWIQEVNKRQLKYSFLVGTCNSECLAKIKEENSKYNDIIQEDFIDAYMNNTYKIMMGLRFITEKCKGAKFVLFIDGDYSLHVGNLLSFLEDYSYTNPEAVKSLYGGRVFWNSEPFRLRFHKHYLSLDAYPFSYYPPFVSAGAIILSGELAISFYNLSLYTKYFPFDDVFYGIIAKKLNVTPTDLTEKIPSYRVPSKDDPIHRKLIGSHRYGKILEVEYIYDHFHS